MIDLLTTFIYGIIVGSILQHHFNLFERLENSFRKSLSIKRHRNV